MADALILRFSGVDQAAYDSVNGTLGIDPVAGTGDWPQGLLMHAAGVAGDGTFVVTEVWSSREEQAAFMDTRLGAALAAGGVTTPPETTWVPLIAYQTPGV